jgi:hypothetical protein
MLLEKRLIQLRGFRNVFQDEEIIGFQVPIRSLYYRAVWLSLLRPATVTVDGEKFEGAQITWTISGKTYAQADLEKYSKVIWPLWEPAILIIKKPGGLKIGSHEVEVTYAFVRSYIPPSVDVHLKETAKRKMVLVT